MNKPNIWRISIFGIIVSILICFQSVIFPNISFALPLLLLLLITSISTIYKTQKTLLFFTPSIGAIFWLLRKPMVLFSTPHTMLEGQYSILIIIFIFILFYIFKNWTSISKKWIVVIIKITVFIIIESVIMGFIMNSNNWYFSPQLEIIEWLVTFVPLLLFGALFMKSEFFIFAVSLIPFWMENWTNNQEELNNILLWQGTSFSVPLLLYRLAIPIVFFLIPFIINSFTNKIKISHLLFFLVSSFGLILLSFFLVSLEVIPDWKYSSITILHVFIILGLPIIAAYNIQKEIL